MKRFIKRKSPEQYKEFNSLIKKIKKIEKQDTLQEVDMMAGFCTAEVLRSAKDRKITKVQKEAILETIDSLQNCRRYYLENEDGTPDQDSAVHTPIATKRVNFVVGENEE